MLKNKSVRNAVCIGVLCSVSYLAVYFARNILGTIAPKMIAEGYTEAYIGKVSSIYFTFYAVGQLINGSIGDRIKARYMISMGLFLAGITNFLFSFLAAGYPDLSILVYGLAGFSLSMIYGPMTKVVAENTEPVYATRCSLGYTFSSFLGSPLAGVTAALLTWQATFMTCSVVLAVMAAVCFSVFLLFEKKGIVTYNQYQPTKASGGSVKILLKHRILKFTLISIITGVVRTTVVFWMPTYISQYLNFPSDQAAMIFTVATFIISFQSFITIFIYERLKHNMDRTILLMFLSATLFFTLTYFVTHPVANIACLVLAIMSSNGSACMLWSRYCPSLRDTGMVSGATGFLDFVSYMSASTASTLFANAVSSIGWGNLILVWCGLMVLGIFVALPYRSRHT